MGVRRLNEPVIASVELDDDGRPCRVSWRDRRGSHRGEVESIIDTWYVDDGWWTSTPLRRTYFACQLQSGMRVVAVWDIVARHWLMQR